MFSKAVFQEFYKLKKKVNKTKSKKKKSCGSVEAKGIVSLSHPTLCEHRATSEIAHNMTVASHHQASLCDSKFCSNKQMESSLKTSLTLLTGSGEREG